MTARYRCVCGHAQLMHADVVGDGSCAVRGCSCLTFRNEGQL